MKPINLYISWIAIPILLSACSPTASEINKVKKGIFPTCSNSTLEVMANKFMNNPSWTFTKKNDGTGFVDIVGVISKGNFQGSTIDIHVDVDGQAISISSIEMRGRPWSRSLDEFLLRSLCMG